MFLHKIVVGISILLTYVDDITIMRTDSNNIHQLQNSLHVSSHKMDLRPLTYFLGLEVHTSNKGHLFNQHKYTKDLISLTRLQNPTPMDTPLELNVKYQQNDGELLSDPTICISLSTTFST